MLSRAEPPPARTTSGSAAGSIATPSRSQISDRYADSTFGGISRNG